MIVIDEQAAERIKALGFTIPSPLELAAVKNRCIRHPNEIPMRLAEFGIADPDLWGWSSYLHGIWHWEGSVMHDTVFDGPFRAKWMAIPSGKRVPLINVRSST